MQSSHGLKSFLTADKSTPRTDVSDFSCFTPSSCYYLNWPSDLVSAQVDFAIWLKIPNYLISLNLTCRNNRNNPIKKINSGHMWSQSSHDTFPTVLAHKVHVGIAPSVVLLWWLSELPACTLGDEEKLLCIDNHLKMCYIILAHAKGCRFLLTWMLTLV